MTSNHLDSDRVILAAALVIGLIGVALYFVLKPKNPVVVEN